MIRKIIAQSENAIVESNSIVELVRPDVFLMLLISRVRFQTVELAVYGPRRRIRGG